MARKRGFLLGGCGGGLELRRGGLHEEAAGVQMGVKVGGIAAAFDEQGADLVFDARAAVPPGGHAGFGTEADRFHGVRGGKAGEGLCESLGVKGRVCSVDDGFGGAGPGVHAPEDMRRGGFEEVLEEIGFGGLGVGIGAVHVEASVHIDAVGVDAAPAVGGSVGT